MLIRLPRHLPTLHALLADLGYPKPAELAEALDVHPRTVRRWMLAGEAPRPVLLALFWVSRWGQSAMECDIYNDVMLRLGIARSLAEESERLAGRMAHLAGIADFGSANDPMPVVMAADPMRQRLKAFLEKAAPAPGSTADRRGEPTESPGSASGSDTEETQQLRAMRRG